MLRYNQKVTTVALGSNQYLKVKFMSSFVEHYCSGFTDGKRDTKLDGHYYTKELNSIQKANA